MITRPTALVVTVDAENYYRGYTVAINGVPVAHRPYDGSAAEAVEREVAEALGILLRQVTGWPEKAEEDESYA